MTYKEMQDFLIEKTRNHTTIKLDGIKRIINLAKDIVLGQRDRPELNKTITMNTVSGTSTGYVIDDPEIELIKRIIITSDNISLTELPLEIFNENFTDQTLFTPDVPEFYAIEGKLGVKAQPASGATIVIVSDATADTTQKVTLTGIVSGVRQQEVLTLNGTTVVTSTKTFTSLSHIEKNAKTTGVVTSYPTGFASNILTKIPPDSMANMYIYFRVHPIPNGVLTLRMLCRKTVDDMVEDNDTPANIYDKEFHNAILGMAEALILKDPSMAAVSMNADKDKRKVNSSFGMRTIDRRAYRESSTFGRYMGHK